MDRKIKLLVLEEKEVFYKHVPAEMLENCAITIMSQFSPVSEILSAGADADILLVNPTIAVSRALIEGLPHIRLIQTEGVGYEGVDLSAASGRRIWVCNCPGVNAHSVAEHTIMLMLCCLRDVITGNDDVLSGRQNDKKVYYMRTGSLLELGECTVGFIGFGAIAREAAALARSFGAKTLYYKPRRLPEEEEAPAEYRPLDDLLSESDIVSLNLPLNRDTENMADAGFFSRMKKGAYLINTARGGLVNSADLISAIESGQLAGAGLDCLANEPVQPDNILVTAPESVRKKIVFSPHIAGVSGASFAATYQIIWDNIQKVMHEESPAHPVNDLT